MKHVSIDTEACGEVLLSIGACAFDPITGESSDEFYAALSAQPQIERGLKMDGGAFEWWLRQSAEARLAVSSPNDPEQGLSGFCAFMARQGDCWVWAYPTSFDLPLIQRVMAAYGLRCPWKWTQTLDGRTLWRLACAIDPSAAKLEQDGPLAHNALADARQQARWFARYLAPILGDKPLTASRTP